MKFLTILSMHSIRKPNSALISAASWFPTWLRHDRTVGIHFTVLFSFPISTRREFNPNSALVYKILTGRGKLNNNVALPANNIPFETLFLMLLIHTKKIVQEKHKISQYLHSIPTYKSADKTQYPNDKPCSYFTNLTISQSLSPTTALS